MATYTPQGVQIKSEVVPSGALRVYWMSDWSRADELVTAGVLRRDFREGHGNPYAQTVEYSLA